VREGSAVSDLHPLPSTETGHLVTLEHPGRPDRQVRVQGGRTVVEYENQDTINVYRYASPDRAVFSHQEPDLFDAHEIRL
jgi:hypothetical protein